MWKLLAISKFESKKRSILLRLLSVMAKFERQTEQFVPLKNGLFLEFHRFLFECCIYFKDGDGYSYVSQHLQLNLSTI